MTILRLSMLRPSRALNPLALGLRCVRCGTVFALGDYHQGCPACHDRGVPASLAIEYAELPKSLDRLADWQIYPDHPTLGEGDTPLVRMDGLAREIGVQDLFVKNEGANPTGSHKDRMSRFIVQRALDAGATTVAAASSGNAGASLAAYAAHVGLACVVVTTPDMNPNWRRAIEVHGATLMAAETPERRWQAVAERVKTGQWYPATNFISPAVGSNPFGVDGLRSIALEIFRDLGGRCTDIVVPTARADLLWAIARGYCDLRRAGFLVDPPRVHAVEPFARLSKVLAGEDYRGTFPGRTALVSIGGSTVTYQAMDAIASCGGNAVVTDDIEVHEDQDRLARCGLYLELSSAAALTGARKLIAKGAMSADAVVVLVGTSSGLSEFHTYTEAIATVT
ncbi:pyridoxal-phosphate dependent enzyme [Mesorhizobium sp.]|uniref:pyridoxal-phosphate dependent enzyme n=1 Tax=Mesorhizobium sp. TaxID=1871066 RepID=UPI0025BD6DEA|nr:pyridoxal-phosphate dependent enzyme [Mesorhizobium sp.]